ncbi:transposase [Duganella sp.]|uniref:transposase n=1 Tax=Duganella sp. TaxID=1904440 RepID=UPI0031DAF5E8
MTRPLRLEFPGALYHVTSRGDHKALIFYDDTDRAMWLQTLGEVCARFHFSIHAFCQMNNHYHLLLETTEGKLSKGMRRLCPTTWCMKNLPETAKEGGLKRRPL